jgi:hypothetical protein
VRCKICESESDYAFRKRVLLKYDVSYFKCRTCGFLQTEEPHWLSEAYNSTFTNLDVYLVYRPLELARVTQNVILNYFDNSGRFLDYGGGAGIFTRHMRDLGFDFYRQDKYATNVCAQYFDLEDLEVDRRRFELVTCFEVLEHLVDPLEEIGRIFRYGASLLCGTQVQPEVPSDQLANWDYLGESHGQHVSFYSKVSFEVIARRFGCNYYSDGVGIHLLTTKRLRDFTSSRTFARRLAHFTRRKVSGLLGGRAAFRPNEPLTLSDARLIAQKIEDDAPARNGQ